jgi:hypothetical protein
MKKTILMDKYPIFSLEIDKNETTYKSVSEIINYLEGLVESHPIAVNIAVFNHYEHTSSMDDGTIAPEIKDAKNLVFCFGKQLPTTKILAVRPRSIGVCELENSFVIDFLEVPNEQLHVVTEGWVKSIANI